MRIKNQIGKLISTIIRIREQQAMVKHLTVATDEYVAISKSFSK